MKSGQRVETGLDFGDRARWGGGLGRNLDMDRSGQGFRDRAGFRGQGRVSGTGQGFGDWAGFWDRAEVGGLGRILGTGQRLGD